MIWGNSRCSGSQARPVYRPSLASRRTASRREKIHPQRRGCPTANREAPWRSRARSSAPHHAQAALHQEGMGQPALCDRSGVVVLAGTTVPSFSAGEEGVSNRPESRPSPGAPGFRWMVAIRAAVKLGGQCAGAPLAGRLQPHG